MLEELRTFGSTQILRQRESPKLADESGSKVIARWRSSPIAPKAQQRSSLGQTCPLSNVLALRKEGTAHGVPSFRNGMYALAAKLYTRSFRLLVFSRA